MGEDVREIRLGRLPVEGEGKDSRPQCGRAGYGLPDDGAVPAVQAVKQPQRDGGGVILLRDGAAVFHKTTSFHALLCLSRRGGGKEPADDQLVLPHIADGDAKELLPGGVDGVVAADFRAADAV